MGPTATFKTGICVRLLETLLIILIKNYLSMILVSILQSNFVFYHFQMKKLILNIQMISHNYNQIHFSNTTKKIINIITRMQIAKALKQTWLETMYLLRLKLNWNLVQRFHIPTGKIDFLAEFQTKLDNVHIMIKIVIDSN